jgi:hypothetical protein
MAPYASVSDLASFLKQDLDTATATLALTKATALFDQRAKSHWGGTVAITYSKPGVGSTEIVMPYAPLVAVSAVRINGVTISLGFSGYTVIEQSLFRQVGFGIPWRFPPDLVEVDYTYGYPTVTDDVAAMVLESAAAMYMSPDVSTRNESIDDYSVRAEPDTGGASLSKSAKELADWYAGVLVG